MSLLKVPCSLMAATMVHHNCQRWSLPPRWSMGIKHTSRRLATGAVHLAQSTLRFLPRDSVCVVADTPAPPPPLSSAISAESQRALPDITTTSSTWRHTRPTGRGHTSALTRTATRNSFVKPISDGITSASTQEGRTSSATDALRSLHERIHAAGESP